MVNIKLELYRNSFFFNLNNDLNIHLLMFFELGLFRCNIFLAEYLRTSDLRFVVVRQVDFIGSF